MATKAEMTKMNSKTVAVPDAAAEAGTVEL